MPKKINNTVKMRVKDTALMLFTSVIYSSLALAFLIACVIAIYQFGIDTGLVCLKSSNKCIVYDKNILGIQKINYEFSAKDLKSLKIEENTNIFGQRVFEIAVYQKGKKPRSAQSLSSPRLIKKYIVTTGTESIFNQKLYIQQIEGFMNASRKSKAILELINKRSDVRNVGILAAGLGLVASIFAIVELIKNIFNYINTSKQQNARYEQIANNIGYFNN
jgi:hypothetical protein